METPRRDVLILTGTCGVGKTTLSRAWAANRGGAAVQCDEIREWIRPHLLRKERGYQEGALAQVALTAAREFLALGLDVALDNVWIPRWIGMMTEALAPLARVRSVWLVCESAENRRRDLLRPGDVMGARVDELAGELANMDWPQQVARIDTTGLDLQQTLVRIERLFSAGNCSGSQL